MDKQRTTSFSLGDHYGKFLEGLVGSGRYGSASEVVREALRLLEKRLEFEQFVRSQPLDDEGPEDVQTFALKVAARRKERRTDQEVVMRRLLGDE